ncbi:MAG: hypothetical protein WCY29_15740 [Novosphingobium sp.]
MLKEIHVRAVLLLLWAFALAMALNPRPPELPTDLLNDKSQHMLAFAVLTAFARAGFGKLSDRLILVRMSLAGAAIELLQAIPALHRDCDWRDWLADTLAVAAVLLVMRCLPWRRLVTQPAG